jgi:cation diffusion facilitator CzcD-associated flavoprotein CzcO
MTLGRRRTGTTHAAGAASTITAAQRAARSKARVVVVGAGMGGLCAAQKLVEYGFEPVVLEKHHEVGGTWRDNAYPGLYVDIPVSLYQLRFAPKYDWSHAYAPGPEIQQYLVQVSADHDLRRYVRFGVEVESAVWADDSWTLRTTAGETYVADAVVTACGFLHRPRVPRIAGMDTFAGVSFHSSAWPQGLSVEGQRVAVVGSGSSGIQMVCALSSMDCRVDQYVRTPQWVETVKNPSAGRAARLVGAVSHRLGRRLTTRLVKAIEQDPRLLDPHWKLDPGPMRDGAMDALREDLLAVRDPDLRAALTPDYPPGCKRVPKSPWYYDAVQRPNVRIFRQGVEEIVPEGIVGPDGAVEPYDVIVYATGFDAHAYMRPMSVTGPGGLHLDEVWKDDPFSYRGVAVPGMPNLFVLNGPFSPVNNVTVPKTLDDETDWLCRVLAAAAEQGCAFAPSQAATDEFLDWVGEALPRTVWWDGCDNWYRGSGKLPVLWPWLDVEHEQMFADTALDRLDRFPLAGASAAQDS